MESVSYRQSGVRNAPACLGDGAQALVDSCSARRAGAGEDARAAR